MNEKVLEIAKKEVLIPVCPEQLAGMSTPRNSAEIVDGKILEQDGRDMTRIYMNGVSEAMKVVEMLGVTEAILKQKSPTCGCGKIYDGTFSGNLTDGDGLFTKALKQKNIKVVSEEDL